MKNNNYPTWLVPLYIAQKLKEIGFNEYCYFYWDNHLNLVDCYNNENGYPDLEGYNSNKHQIKCSLPTWTEVLAWFKKHYYHVNIDDKGTWIHWSFYNEMIEPPIIENEPKDGWETDYYEALEALVVALIKTYKQEQLK